MKRKKLHIVLILLLILLMMLIITLVILKDKNKKVPIALSFNIDEKTTQKIDEIEKNSIKEKLSNLSESKRIEYYATEFIKALDGRQYKTAYGMLNNDFKKNYFATYESFEAYVKKYIPRNIGIKYNNTERLGEIYVMEIEVQDVLSTDNPNNYNGYIVIKENDYNEFELSFSVDSAMQKSNTEESNG